jgi:uncharacterized phage-associated protein
MMSNVQFQKITQAINFLLRQSPDKKLNKLHLMKLVWAADRYHLRKYGRLVTEDSYVAMPKGPVASLALDIINNDSDFLPEESVEYGHSFIRLNTANHEVTSLDEVDGRFLSESDEEALIFSWSTFSSMPRFELADFTHRYPEWKKHESVLEHLKTSIPINLLDFFENPTGSERDPFEQDQSLLAANRESFTQNRTLKKIFQ